MKLDLNLIEFLKLPTRIVVSIAIGVGLLLFLPDILLDKIYILSFREEYGFILGITFIITFTISFVSISLSLYSYYKNKKRNKWFIETAGKRINDLSDYQKAVIFMLYQENNHTFELPIKDGGIKILEHNLIIQKATTQVFLSDTNDIRIPYFLQVWVINEIKNNDYLLTSLQESYNKINSGNSTHRY